MPASISEIRSAILTALSSLQAPTGAVQDGRPSQLADETPFRAVDNWDGEVSVQGVLKTLLARLPCVLVSRGNETRSLQLTTATGEHDEVMASEWLVYLCVLTHRGGAAAATGTPSAIRFSQTLPDSGELGLDQLEDIVVQKLNGLVIPSLLGVSRLRYAGMKPGVIVPAQFHSRVLRFETLRTAPKAAEPAMDSDPLTEIRATVEEPAARSGGQTVARITY